MRGGGKAKWGVCGGGVAPEMMHSAGAAFQTTSRQLYMTVQEQSKCTKLPILPLTPSLVCAVCVCVRKRKRRSARGEERLQGRQRRFKIFSSLSAQTHFSLCTAAQICKWSLLRMQSTRSASIYSSPLARSSFLTLAIPLSLCSSRLSVSLSLTHPSPSSLHRRLSIPHFAFCCLVLACALSEELQVDERISLHSTSKHRGQIKSCLIPERVTSPVKMQKNKKTKRTNTPQTLCGSCGFISRHSCDVAADVTRRRNTISRLPGCSWRKKNKKAISPTQCHQ